MEKLDLKKARKELFTAPAGRFVELLVPPCLYLMTDGHGDPNSVPEYPCALQALYTTAYAFKAELKPAGRDFVVPPLEGLWSSPDPESFRDRRKGEWDWTMMIMVPDHVEGHHFDAARKRARRKIGDLVNGLRLASLAEGLCLQALHIGSYDDETPLLADLHDRIMPAGGYTFAGRHHEIYLSDPRKTEASKLRTILRQPVRAAD
jgi:hypothetical protein